MITLQPSQDCPAFSLSLRHITVFRTQPIRFAFRAPSGKEVPICKNSCSDRYTILFGLHGKVYIREKARAFQLMSHSFLLIAHNHAFSITADEHENASFLAVEFEISPKDFVFDLTKHGSLFIENAKTFTPFFSELETITESQNTYGEAILLTLFEKIRQERMEKGDPQLLYQHAIARVRRHFADPPTSTLIAFGSHYTPDHLTKLLKNAHGISLSELIKRERLKILKNYLRFTSYSVERIAKILAFSSTAAMVNFFKYHTGVTPNEYRKLLKGQTDEQKNSL